MALSLVSSFTYPYLARARLAVATDTPASRATSFMVTGFFWFRADSPPEI